MSDKRKLEVSIGINFGLIFFLVLISSYIITPKYTPSEDVPERYYPCKIEYDGNYLNGIISERYIDEVDTPHSEFYAYSIEQIQSDKVDSIVIDN